MIEFGVLGPLEVRRDGVAVAVEPAKWRRLLTLLLCRAGEPVEVPALIEALWNGQPPASARKNLQGYVHRLRHSIAGQEHIVHSAAGYAIIVGAGQVDALRFADLVDRGQAAYDRGDLESAGATLRQALKLWRGTPYADASDVAIVMQEVRRLEEAQLRAQELSVCVDLELGRHSALIGELGRLATAHPYRERLRCYWMLALYRSGRQAEALEVFRDTRALLIEELGIEPGPELRALNERILRADPALGPPPAGGHVEVRPGLPVPRQLPGDVPGFTGRASVLHALNRLLPADGTAPAGAVAIPLLSGTAGVGKTTLAVHWAHQVAARFPDGQLYVNLRGFDPNGPVMTPGEAVRGFLHALGVPADDIPPALDAQVALYRSLLADRRVLVVLDNARDAEQVRPLLPGSSGCAAVVTSREQLTGLVAMEGACPLTVDLLTPTESRQLLAGRLGACRVAAEPQAVEEIVAACAGLPLALAVVAARAATRPAFPLAAVADALSDSGDLWAVFSWSYRTLGTPVAELFRLLSLHPGPDVTVPAAASLAGVPVARARRLLAELTRAHLLTEQAPGRYGMHDLLRAYAAELTRRWDGDTDRHAALHRMFDHYLHTAHGAALLLNPSRDPLSLVPAQPGVTVHPLLDHDEALAWFAAEHAVVVGAVQHAAEAGFDAHAWQLVWTLADFLTQRGRHDPNASGLGDDTLTHYRHALSQWEKLTESSGRGRTHLSLALAFARQAGYSDTLRHSEQALRLFRAAGHQIGQAFALVGMWWAHGQLGDHGRALPACQEVLSLYVRIGDRYGQAAAWDSLGQTLHHLGRHAQAAASYQEALTLFQQLGERYGEAYTLTRLGATQRAAGEHEAAYRAWLRALSILTELGHPDAHTLRTNLHALFFASTHDVTAVG
ncbi:BTAD domain-containing putative transcriptional regulator [Microbispora sp. ZYX-F-249]|uniref:BTAD domain-containing putative transcriptional regulator n=1 Tax=Microbispora maris TaxID=3144104 RepID=A0ABV0AWH9_9ACTN